MENIKIGLKIDANTKEATADAKKLNDQLKQAAETAKNIRVGGGQAAPTAGPSYRAAKQPTGATTQGQPVGSQEVMQYGSLRGTAGATGASARDFANQAQGLSGLVRLYAIYAANIYAVGAAFGALSRAVDTANLTKGMEQLGAQSGVSLGTLSQGLVAATGYAINLREAMQATVKVTAAGLGASQVERLGKVATKASQALGVDINDAISRLSRGITKLEPELLDELGLFTKLDESTQRYARSVGKTAEQITDFEKRQAFANAVLAEGERKFGALQLDANPYNKLTAALSNLVQQGLEFTNKFLIPVIDLLSKSPTALIGALTAVGFTILKQAVPAITSLREGLQQKAGQASEAAAQKAQESVALRKKLSDEMIKIAEAQADKELGAVIRAETKMQELREKGVKMGPGLAKAFGKPEVKDVTERELRGIEAESLRLAKAGETEKAEFYRESAKAIRDSKNAEIEYAKVRAENISQAEKDINNKRSIIGLNQKMAESLEKASYKSSTVANAAYAGSLIGPINAVKLLNAQLKEDNVTGFSKNLLLARGSVAAFAGALSTVGSYLSGAFAWFGLLASILPVVIGFFSKTAEESQKTGEALKGLDTSTKTLSDTLDAINKKPVLEQFNAESVQARANAIGGLAEQVSKLVQASNKELEKMGTVDVAVNWVKKLWGGDVESKAVETISKGLAKTFEAIDENSEAGKAFISNVKKITQIEDISSFEKLRAAIEKLPDSKTALAQLSTELDKVGNAGKISAAKLTELEQSFKKVQEARTKFVNENIPKDSFTEYGNALIDTFFKLDLALKDPQRNLQAIIRLSEELKNVAAPKDLIIGLASLANSAKQIQVLDENIADINKNITKLSDELENTSIGITSFEELNNSATNLSPEIQKVINEIGALKKEASGKTELQIKLRTEIENASKQLEQAQYLLLERGSQAVASRLANEFAKAGTTVTNAIAGILSGTQAGIEMKARADKAMLQVQIAGLRAQEALIKAQLENTVALKEKTLQDERLLLQNSNLPSDERKPFQENIDRLQKEIEGSRKLLTGGSFAQFSKGLPKGDLQNMQALLSQAQALDSTRAAIANALAQVEGIDLQKVAALTEDAAKSKLKGLEADLKIQQLQRDQLANTQAISSSTNEAAVRARQQADLELKTAQDAYKLEEARVKIQVFEQVLAKAKNIEDRQSIKNAIAQQEKLIELSKSAQPQERANQALKDQIELVKVRAAQEVKSAQIEFDAESKRLQATEDALQLDRDRFELDKQRFQLTERFVVQEQAEQERAQARIRAARELFEAEKLRRTQTQEQQTRREQIVTEGIATGGISGEGDVSPAVAEALREVNNQIGLINANYETATQRTQQILTNTLTNVSAQEQLNLKQAEYNKLLREVSAISDSIRGAFEGLGGSVERFGTGLAGFVDTFANFKVDSEKAATNIANLNEASNQAEIAGNYELAGRYAKEAGEATAKQQKDEMAGYAKLAGSAKKLFSEKTFAYKALGAIEKALHIARLAMTAKEVIVDLLALKTKTGAHAAAEQTNNATSMQGIMKRLPAKLGEIYASTIGQLGPIAGPVVAAALVAMVVAMIGKAAGGGPKSAPSVGTKSFFEMSPEQRRETQGTGSAYGTDGKLRDVGGGVFGDNTQKADSVVRSLEIIKETTVDGLSYDNKVVQLLTKINDGINNTAKSLYGIEGLRTGSMFGVREGASSGGGLFGSGVLASKTSTNVTDSGLIIRGTFEQLAGETKGAVMQFYEQVTTTTKKWYGKTRTSVATLTKNLETDFPDVVRGVNEIFGDSIRLYTEIGSKIGINAQTVRQRLASLGELDLSASLRGLKGDELKQEFQAVISRQLNLGSEAVFAFYKRFQEFGEELFETVARVTDQTTKANQQLKNIGLTTIEDIVKSTTPTMRQITRKGWYGKPVTETVQVTQEDINKLVTTVTDDLIKLSGGFEQFQEKTNLFRDKFLTETEKLAPKIGPLNEALGKFGLSANSSRESFKQVVQGLNLTTEAGRQSFATLMTVAKDFDEVAEYNEKILDERKGFISRLASLAGQEKQLRAIELEKINESNKALQLLVWKAEDQLKVLEKRQNLEQKILQLENKTAALREYELSLIDDSLDYLQVRIYTLEEEKALLQRLGSARKTEANNIKSTIGSIRQAIASLKDYRTSLLTSEMSPLKTQDKYELKKSELNALATIINKTPVTPEDKKAQLDAATKFQQISKEFLDISKTLFASSPQYTTDFNKVVKILDYTADNILQDSLTNEEKQLQKLEDSNTFLGSINDSAETVVDILNDLYTAYITGLATSSKDQKFYFDKIFGGIEGVSGTVLTFAQTKEALKGLAEDSSLDAIIAQADANKDGLIDSIEGSSLAQTISLLNSFAESIKLLGQLGQTVLTFDQIRQALVGIAEDETINSLITSADANNNGLIEQVEGTSLKQTLELQGYLANNTEAINKNLKNIESLTLTYDQIRVALTNTGLATTAIISTLISEADADNNRLISSLELSNLNQQVAIVSSLASGFANLDTNLDSKLSSEEFIAGLTGKIPNTEIARLFAMLDADNNALITNAELTRSNTAQTIDRISTVKDSTDVVASFTELYSDLLQDLGIGPLNSTAQNTASLVTSNNSMVSLLEDSRSYLKTLSEKDFGSGGVAPAQPKKENIFQKVGRRIKKLFSDADAKTDIEYYTTTPSGINLYNFRYKDPSMGTGQKRGVLAQEIMKDYPSAVYKDFKTGYLKVDYDKLPISQQLLKFADGGYANPGLAVVGENGPEVVDFKSPGRVYTAEQTFGMFNGSNQALVQEIKELRKEVQKLREQQHKETGALISATFDAQKEAANKISDTVTNTADKSAWEAKLKKSVKLI